ADCEVGAPGTAAFDATVFASERTGDQVLVTLRLTGSSVVVKMPKEFEIRTDASAGVAINSDHLYIFDGESGMRIRPG
ncbi:MAG: hypothetical protein OXC91_14005, partial [Rhodobacteraceae bacterium]|nr:hypothetical protein [Paracoccaceae bacterium]